MYIFVVLQPAATFMPHVAHMMKAYSTVVGWCVCVSGTLISLRTLELSTSTAQQYLELDFEAFKIAMARFAHLECCCGAFPTVR